MPEDIRDSKHHKLVKHNLQIVYRHTIPQRMNERSNTRMNEMKTIPTHARRHT